MLQKTGLWVVLDLSERGLVSLDSKWQIWHSAEVTNLNQMLWLGWLEICATNKFTSLYTHIWVYQMAEVFFKC
jgi:hypothetical protein